MRMSHAKRILIILTGGTFGMKSESGAPLAPAELEDRLTQMMPEITHLADIQIMPLFQMDSSDIQPEHWQKLAAAIYGNLSDVDGFVIIHGTDTMAFTASALSFMLVNLNKPVILTGSQRPLSEIRSDARFNLINAIECATLDIPEVAICFENVLLRGNRAKKISTDAFDAFQSPNFEPLGEIGLNIYLSDEIRRPEGLVQVMNSFDPRVISLPIFPGMRPDDLNVLAKSAMRAVIFEAYGAGNVPTVNPSFIPVIQMLTEHDKIVAIKSQCISGHTDLRLYQGGAEAIAAGAISCHDMTREASIVKMMFLLGNVKQTSDIRRHFQENLCGEVSQIGSAS